MTAKFKLRDWVYNSITKEDGAITRVYETSGAAMYEVAVAKCSESRDAGFYISDWAGDLLQPSTNERLRYPTPEKQASRFAPPILSPAFK